MNRSLANVLFGAFGKVGARPRRRRQARTGRRCARPRRTTSPSCWRTRGASSSSPVTGSRSRRPSTTSATSRTLLEEKGVDVKYAIHPVAGRMPGHMNVLLAEANVRTTSRRDGARSTPNSRGPTSRSSIGANDVTNPAARNQTGSPIYGMPILDVDKAKNVVVIKRRCRRASRASTTRSSSPEDRRCCSTTRRPRWRS